MSRLAFSTLLIAGALLAQKQPVKAPARVDQALRGRVSEYYQACVDKKFRVAEGIVAQKDRDLFYANPKPVYDQFKIQGMTYSKDLTGAKVLTMVGMEFRMPGQLPMPIKRPLETEWKRVGGQWFLILDTGVVQTPFGAIKKTPGGSAPPPGMPPGMPMGGSKPPAPLDLKNLVKADKPEVRFAESERTETVTLTNTMGGPVTLAVDDPRIPGLSVSLDRATVPSGEQARLTLAWKGAPKPQVAAVEVSVRLKELPVAVPVKVVFTAEK